LLMATGFANDVEAHRTWEPKPAGEPPEIDPARLAAAIHERLAILLVPIGFQRQGDEWRRAGEVPQAVRVLTGLSSRTEVKFFLRVSLEAKPVRVVLHLPRLPGGPEKFGSEQGYVFRAGDSVETLYAAVVRDVDRYAQSWFQRFTSVGEVQRGFDDGTFAPHIPVEGQALIF
jgi:hypothetical protein